MSVPYALFSANGTPGATGAVGATGAAGTNGTNGLVGATGAAGTNGTNGLAGATGAVGATGAASGLVGATGPTGANSTVPGPAGSIGLTGATGAAATNYTAGTGISISSGTIINTAPDQTVALTGTGITNVTGTYPNFTVSTPKIIRGTSSGGFAPTIINGSGFTVVHANAGTYTVTFTTPFTNTPTAVASIFNLGFTAAQIEVTSTSTTTMVIKTYTISSGSLYASNSLQFSFIAIDN